MASSHKMILEAVKLFQPDLWWSDDVLWDPARHSLLFEAERKHANVFPSY